MYTSCRMMNTSMSWLAFSSTSEETDTLDISALMPEGATAEQLPDYLHISDEFNLF